MVDRLLAILIVCCLAAAPITLFVLWRGLLAVRDMLGLPGFFVGAAGVAVTCLGLALLIDKRERQGLWQHDARSGRR